MSQSVESSFSLIEIILIVLLLRLLNDSILSQVPLVLQRQTTAELYPALAGSIELFILHSSSQLWFARPSSTYLSLAALPSQLYQLYLAITRSTQL